MANKPWDEKRKALTEILKGIRLEKGLTQTELAERLGKPQSYISKFESGERKLDFVEVMELCAVLGVRPEFLVAEYLSRGY
jgi:transcriptional regulator with XRE-family HTH domain